MATHEWELDGDDDREPCPMGCGNLTDDVAGGPCTGCMYGPEPEDPRLEAITSRRADGGYASW